MIAVILWKEYREQRAVWLVLAALVVGVLVGLPSVFAADFDHHHQDSRKMLLVVGVVLTWAYGMVSGGMLLAGEREARTDSFLDTLPGGRGRLWVAKYVAGLVLVTAFAVFVAVLALTNALVAPTEWFGGSMVLLVAGGLGLGWGLYTSAFARTVLGAVGLAITVQCGFYLIALVIGVFLFSLFQAVSPESQVGPLLPTFVLICLLFPLPFSALAYRLIDRRRLRDEAKTSDFRRSAAVMLWLVGRQIRGLAVWLLPLSLVLGLLAIPQPLILWPFLTLGLGVVCGVSCFLDEQSGPRRLLGDQRYPLGPIWGVKVGLRLALLLSCLFVAIAPLLVLLFIDLGAYAHDRSARQALSGRLFRSGLVGLTVPADVMLFAPALTGFAVGLLSGIVFRKAFIAGMAGMALALLAFVVWVPGLLLGGVPSWQVFLVPLILLVAARLLMRPWAAERLVSRNVVLAMTGLVVVCLILFGLGQWYRVASVPDTPQPPELAAALAAMPDDAHNEAGQLLRSTLAAIQSRSSAWSEERPTKPLRSSTKPPEHPGSLSYLTQVNTILEQGWPDRPMEQIEWAGWLDRVFAEEMWARLDRLPALPLGVVDDPRRMDNMYRFTLLSPAHLTADLLAARGLQMQKQGRPEVFVQYLEILLALVRNIQNTAPQLSVNYASMIEGKVLTALDRWLESLSGRPDLLRRVGVALTRHRASETSDSDHDLAEYLIAQNTLDNPAPWLSEVIQESARDHTAGAGERWRLGIASAIVPESTLLVYVLQIPWERERQERLLRRVYFAGRPPESHDTLLMPVFRPSAQWRESSQLRGRTRLEAMRLIVALRQHQATTGKAATDLGQLVPASIDAIPADPYDGRPFRYRLSAGEEIEGMPVPDEAGTPIATTRKIPAGQGVLWSVGPDRRDEGGKVHGNEKGDLIFLVPIEKK